MAKKNLEQQAEAEGEPIEFDFGGTHYREPMANLKLDTMTPSDIRTALDRVTPKYAYWSSKAADISKTIREVETNYEVWFAQKRTEVKIDNVPKFKISETMIKNEAILVNVKDYKKKQEELSNLYYVRDKMTLLVKSFEMQSRLLQTIASLLKAEMGMLGKEE
jgi:hypothetical protein